MTPTLESSLQDVKDAVDVNTTSFITELEGSVTDVNLTTFAQSLRDLGDELVANATTSTEAAAISTRTDLYNHAASLDNIAANELQDLQTSVNSLKTHVATLHNQKNQVVVDVDKLNASLRNTEDFLNNDATPLLSQETEKYIGRVTRTLDTFINYTLDAVKYDMGKCDIVYKLFADMFTIGVCKYTLDAFNAIWLALGWCIFFFTVSIVFAVKLSKHFRRMHHLDGRYIPVDEAQESAKLIPSLDSVVIQPIDVDFDETKESAKLIPKRDSDVIQPVDLDLDETKESGKLLPTDGSGVIKPGDV
ncbi:prominin-1-like isoform X2 [Liolophura sinensis]|uniref:prominin-1-like isoform X2 n=1 Tax=Liolophura sinensis TaxID=3198878 RepID=UPI003158C76D